MDWKIRDQATNTADKEEEASSWLRSPWNEAVKCAHRLFLGLLEIQLGKEFPVEKAKWLEINGRVQKEIETLLWEHAWAKLGVSSEVKCEKTMREKCLEAVKYWWKTAKEVCHEVHPELVEGSLDWKRSVRAVSMCLMRLSKERSEKLVKCDKSRREYRYVTTLHGFGKLLRYREERKEAERKKLLHGLMENVVKSNESLLPEFEAMQECHSSALMVLENAEQSQYSQQRYGRIICMLVRQIVACQRALIEDDDDVRVKAIEQSTGALLQLLRSEVEAIELWIFGREHQKLLKNQLEQKEGEIKELQERTKSRQIRTRNSFSLKRKK